MKIHNSALWAALVTLQLSLEVESFASGPSLPKTSFSPSFSGPLERSNSWDSQSRVSGTPNQCFGSALYATRGPLTQEGSWHAFLDEDDTGLVYYYNAKSGKSQWNPPTRTFPQVDLTHRMKRRMSRVQTSYIEKSKESQTSTTKKEEDSNPWMEKLGANMNFPDLNFVAAGLGTQRSSSGGPSLNFPALNLPWQTAAVEQSSLFEEEATSGTFLDSLTWPKVLDNFNLPWEKPAPPAPSPVEEYTFKTEETDNMVLEAAGQGASLMERMETTKAAMVGFVSGSAAAPLTAMHNWISPEAAAPWGYDLVESALFAIVYRYCIRESQENEKLQESIRQDFVGAFVLVRTLSQLRMSSLCATTAGGDCGPFHFDFQMFQQGLVGGLESVIMFGFAATAMDFCMKKGLISKLK